MRLDPRDIPVHPALQELAAIGTDSTRRVEQTFLRLDEAFRLTERRAVQVGEHVAQVLLRHRGADGADRDTEDARRLARPSALPRSRLSAA